MLESKIRILLIEDNPGDARLVHELLWGATGGASRFEIELADRLSRGLERLSTEKMDVVLLDLGLPDSKGLDTLQRLREQTEKAVVVVLTGLDDEEVAVQCLQHGAQDYLVKGRFDSHLLGRSVRYAIERRRAEEALQRERQRFNDILEKLPVMISLLTPDYHVPFANRRFREQFGESHGRRCYDYIFHRTEPCPECQSFTPLKIHAPHHWEWAHPKGSHLDIYDFPFTDSDGSPLVLEMVIDITDRKRAEEALRASEVRYRRLFETAKDGILILDAETGRIVDANPFLSEMLGLSHEQLLGKTIWELGFFKDIIDNQNKFLELQRQGYIRYEDLPLETADGRPIHVEFVSNVYLVDLKKVIQCNIRDITERKRSEEALRASEHRYKTLLENLPQKVFLKDKDSVYVLCNGNYARDLKINPDEIAGKTDSDFYPVELAEKYRADDKRIMESGKTEDLEEPYRQDGQQGWVHTVKTPVRDENGNVTGLLGIFWDIAERRKLEEQLRHAQKMETVGRLAGGVAHDFNNLLTVIGGNCEMALAVRDLPERVRHNLTEVLQAAERAGTLTRQLLAFSRRQPLELRVVNLNDVLGNMDKMLQRLIGENIELVTLPGETLWPVQVDIGQMEQVIINLAVNARDAMAQGGRVILETSNVCLDDDDVRYFPDVPRGDYVMLTTSDTGVGMTDEIKQRIFEPFFTTKEREKGTGLGLATCYGIVKQSKGHIWVYSEPGQGTTFKICLPRVEEKAGALPLRRETSSLPRGNETILLVEDDPSVRLVSSSILRDGGYTVLEATNGEEALRVLRERSGDTIHLVVTDVVMPRMGGKELADEMKLMRSAPKILFTSGYTENAILRSGAVEPGTVLLQKPFTSNALAEKVREVLDA